MSNYSLNKFGKLYLMYKENYNKEGFCIYNIDQNFETEVDLRKWLFKFAREYFLRFPNGSEENTLYIENDKNKKFASIERAWFLDWDSDFSKAERKKC